MITRYILPGRSGLALILGSDTYGHSAARWVLPGGTRVAIRRRIT